MRLTKELYFVTSTVVDWVDVFTRPTYRHIVLDSLRYCQTNKGLALKRFLPDRFQGISKSRELFTHPSFVRLAGELLYESEKYLYRELEEMAEGENAQQ